MSKNTNAWWEAGYKGNKTKTKFILAMLFHATYHYLFEMHFKDYQATHLHLMINSFQGICVDLKCFKGKCIFSLKGNIFSNDKLPQRNAFQTIGWTRSVLKVMHIYLKAKFILNIWKQLIWNAFQTIYRIRNVLREMHFKLYNDQ